MSLCAFANVLIAGSCLLWYLAKISDHRTRLALIATLCLMPLLALLLGRQVFSLLRLHHSRPCDLRKGKRLGKTDRLFSWHKPKQKPAWLPHGWWKKVPAQLTLRVLRFNLHRRGFRPDSVTLVTTLLDAQRYPAEDIAQLTSDAGRSNYGFATSKPRWAWRYCAARVRQWSTKNWKCSCSPIT